MNLPTLLLKMRDGLILNSATVKPNLKGENMSWSDLEPNPEYDSTDIEQVKIQLRLANQDNNALQDEVKRLENECNILANKIDLYRQSILTLLEATESHDV